MHVLFSVSEKELLPCETAICFLDIVMHLRHATFQDQVKVLFFSGGQMKWVEKGSPMSLLLGFHLLLAAAKVFK